MQETTFNQFAAPQAEVADVMTDDAVGELKLFSAKGRIGRLRYMAYGAGAGIAYNIAVGLAALIARDSSALSIMLISPLFVAMLWFGALNGIKRCHDIGISGWWTLTMIVPIIVIAWVFVPGAKGRNDYGPPPPPNTLGVRLLGLIMPVITFVAVIGILAAVAIPQYQSYVQKARAAQAANPQQR